MKDFSPLVVAWRHTLCKIFRPCLLGLGALAAFSGGRLDAQYVDWNANPPKILPNERVSSGIVFGTGSGRQFPNTGAFAALHADGSITASCGCGWSGELDRRLHTSNGLKLQLPPNDL
jgi:hypothetical protein